MDGGAGMEEWLGWSGRWSRDGTTMMERGWRWDGWRGDDGAGMERGWRRGMDGAGTEEWLGWSGDGESGDGGEGMERGWREDEWKAVAGLRAPSAARRGEPAARAGSQHFPALGENGSRSFLMKYQQLQSVSQPRVSMPSLSGNSAEARMGCSRC